MLIEDFLNYLRFTSLGMKARSCVMKRGRSTKEKIDAVIRAHKGTSLSATEYEKLFCTIRADVKKYGFTPEEWFMYELEFMSETEKSEYVSFVTQILVCDRMNDYKDLPLFNKKEKTYTCFNKYYRRELLAISENKKGNEEDFLSFVKGKEKFIAKISDGALGMGVHIFNTADYESPQSLYQILLKEYPKGCIVEELVQQSDAMGKLHPASVNTLRMPTFRYADRVEIIHPFARFGQKGLCVDNGRAGGILCALDVETGEITTARDETGMNHENHPDTGYPLVGMKIPRWEEAVSLAKELAMVRPKNRYIGWDLALTDEGWIMIEGNFRATFVGQQVLEKRGIKKELSEILKEMGIKFKL